MNVPQLFLNGIVLGAFYACIAAGFSLIWGVMNIINMLHGSLVVLGAFLAFFMWKYLGFNPLVALPLVGIATFALGALIQFGLINRVVSAPVLTTLTLTFGLDMIMYNIMNVGFTATSRRITTDYGNVDLGLAILPIDKLLVTLIALALTAVLYLVLRVSSIGRAIVAVRMDSDAAELMGIRVKRIYAIAFGIGAAMAGAAGAVSALVYPVATSMSGAFLSKAFVVCIIGGLGSVPGALIGGITLGLIESFGGYVLGPQHALTLGFLIMLTVLLVRPTGLFGVKGFD